MKTIITMEQVGDRLKLYYETDMPEGQTEMTCGQPTYVFGYLVMEYARKLITDASDKLSDTVRPEGETLQ